MTASNSSNQGFGLPFVLFHNSNPPPKQQHIIYGVLKGSPKARTSHHGNSSRCKSRHGGACVGGGLSDRAERQTKFAVSPEEEEKWLMGGGRLTLLC